MSRLQFLHTQSHCHGSPFSKSIKILKGSNMTMEKRSMEKKKHISNRSLTITSSSARFTNPYCPSVEAFFPFFSPSLIYKRGRIAFTLLLASSSSSHHPFFRTFFLPNTKKPLSKWVTVLAPSATHGSPGRAMPSAPAAARGVSSLNPTTGPPTSSRGWGRRVVCWPKTVRFLNTFPLFSSRTKWHPPWERVRAQVS